MPAHANALGVNLGLLRQKRDDAAPRHLARELPAVAWAWGRIDGGLVCLERAVGAFCAPSIHRVPVGVGQSRRLAAHFGPVIVVGMEAGIAQLGPVHGPVLAGGLRAAMKHDEARQRFRALRVGPVAADNRLLALKAPHRQLHPVDLDIAFALPGLVDDRFQRVVLVVVLLVAGPDLLQRLWDTARIRQARDFTRPPDVAAKNRVYKHKCEGQYNRQSSHHHFSHSTSSFRSASLR